jgi:16S rRNA (guanine966-N2)-methyltransferase
MHIIGGTQKNKPILAPEGLSTRPTSARLREALFNICQGYITDARFLDLYAGSGAMGLEALSRGAKSVSFVDNSKESVRYIQQNLKKMGFEGKGKIFLGDVVREIENLTKQKSKFDIIYIDPPYDAEVKRKDTTVLASRFILQFIDQNSLLAASGMLFIEDSKDSIPDIETLKTLILKSSRKMGRSYLQQYQSTS